jgi:hypothetical protein
MINKYLFFLLFLLLPIMGEAAAYFYCTTENYAYYFFPSATNWEIKGQNLIANTEVTLGNRTYTITAKDIQGKFSSTFGLATPFAYFLYSRGNQTAEQLAADIKKQCSELVQKANVTNAHEAEVRVSDSMFSGSSNMTKTGYPLVIIRSEPAADQSYIERVNFTKP